MIILEINNRECDSKNFEDCRLLQPQVAYNLLELSKKEREVGKELEEGIGGKEYKKGFWGSEGKEEEEFHS